MNKSTIPARQSSGRPLLNTEEAAKRLGVAKNTVEKWRMTGRRDDNTPRFVKIGTAVRYDPDELDAWIERNSTYTTSEYDPYGRH